MHIKRLGYITEMFYMCTIYKTYILYKSVELCILHINFRKIFISFYVFLFQTTIWLKTHSQSLIFSVMWGWLIFYAVCINFKNHSNWWSKYDNTRGKKKIKIKKKQKRDALRYIFLLICVCVHSTHFNLMYQFDCTEILCINKHKYTNLFNEQKKNIIKKLG